MNQGDIVDARPIALFLRRRRGDILDDEHLLAGMDEAELAAGDFFDGRGIFAQLTRFVAQPGVLRALAGDGAGQLVVLMARAQHRQQSAIADERVDENHDRHAHEEKLDDPAGSGRPSGGRDAPLHAWFLSGSHARRRYNNSVKSTTGNRDIVEP